MLKLRDVQKNQPICPHIDCDEYGEFYSCYLHNYAICEKYENWYEGLTREEQRGLSRIMLDNDRE